MLHGTCRELPGGPGWRGHLQPSRRGAARFVQAWGSAGGSRCGARLCGGRGGGRSDAGEPFRSLPWRQDGGKPAAGGLGSPAFPASLALVRERGPAEGTLGKREADTEVLPLKPEFVFQALVAETPRRQHRGSGRSLRGRGGRGKPCEPGRAAASPREPAWRHCPRPLSPAGASRGAAAPLA